MYSKNGKSNLFIWFFAFVSALVIVLFLVLNVGVVNAQEVDSDSVPLRASGPNIYDSVPNGYSTFSDSGFNMDFTNDTFNLSLNYNDLNTVDSNNPFANNQGNYYGLSFDLSFFDNDLSNGEFFLPDSFTYNGNSYSLSLFNNCFISGVNNSITCVFYNDSHLVNSIFCNTSFYSLTNYTRQEYEEDTIEGKLSHSFVAFKTTFDSMKFNFNSVLTDKYLYSNPGGTVSTYLIQFANLFNYSCLNRDSLYYDPNFNANKHYGFVVDENYQENLYDYNYLKQYYSNSSSGSSENDFNNMFLNNAHWTFNIPKGNNSSGFPNSFYNNGKAVFSGLLNSYQSNHLDNFYFHYTFYIQPQYQNGTGSGDSGGGGHPISILDAFRQSSLSNNDTFFPPVFQFNLDGQTYYNQTMTEFNSSGQSCTFFTYDYLWDNCFYNGVSFKEYVDSWHFSNMTNCYLYCTAVMFSTGGGVSGTCQAWYDLVTGQSGVTSENMTINPDPYLPITTNPQNNSNTGQYGNIIINNNNNNNVSGTPVGYTPTQAEQSKFWDLFNPLRFLGDKLFGSHTAYSEDLEQQFGINRYLPLLSENLSSFVPFFTLAAKFFGVALGIMLVAFIIRIVLDLL